jgi:hypothetical protein
MKPDHPPMRLGNAKDPDERRAQIEDRRAKLLEAASPTKMARLYHMKANGRCYTTGICLFIIPYVCKAAFLLGYRSALAVMSFASVDCLCC